MSLMDWAKSGTATKILISTAARIGDALFCTPAIHLLKKTLPNIQLDLLVYTKAAGEVFIGNPDVNKIYLANKPNTIKQLALAYPFMLNLTYEFNKYLSKVTTPLVSIGVPDRSQHRAEQGLRFIQSLTNCTITDTDRRYFVYPKPQDFIQAERLLAHYGIDLSQDILVGCQLGCNRVARRAWKIWQANRQQHPKTWPLERYAAVAEHLKSANPKIKVLLTGSQQEKFLGKAFRKRVPWALDLIGQTSLFELAALMQYLHVYLAHDTGSLHLACTQPKTPLVGLFGSTPVAFTGPYPHLSHHTLIAKSQMTDISVEEVGQAVRDRLATIV